MLTFNLKKEWFDKIKSGEKTHEYREIKPYWEKRITKEVMANIAKRRDAVYEHMHEPDYLDRIKEITDIPLIICFKCGYPKSNEEDKILYAKFESCRITYGKYTDLAISKRVYDIEFELCE